MAELQKTFDGELQPTRNHETDIVTTVDGNSLDCFQERGNCFAVRVPRFPNKQKPLTEEIQQRIRNGEFSNLQVTIADSILAGNCRDGTHKFLQRGGFSETQLTISELLERFHQLPKLFRDEYANNLEKVILLRVETEIKATTPELRITEEIEYYRNSDTANTRTEEIQEEIRDYNFEILKEYFNNVETWANDYVRSDDYVGEYAYLMREGTTINDSLQKMLEPWNYTNYTERETTRGQLGLLEEIELPPDFVNTLVTKILDNDCFGIEYSDPYATPSIGYLDSFQIDEYEEQIEVSNIREATEGQLYLPDSDFDFYDCLAEYIANNRDHCLSHWTRNGEHVSEQLRKQYATFEMHVSVNVRIDFVLQFDQAIEETINETLIECFRNRQTKSATKRGVN